MSDLVDLKSVPDSQTIDNSAPTDINAPQGLVWANCTPNNVAVFTDRVHVIRCSSDVNGIWYFAYPTADDAEATRVLSLLTSAQVTGRLLQILYDPADTTSGPPISCNANDCRVITAVALY